MAPELRRVHHLSLSVTDLDRSVQWYRDVLDLNLDVRFETETFARARFRNESGTVILTLTCHDERHADSFDERRPGLDHVAFEVDAEDFDDVAARFDSLGVTHSEVKEPFPGARLMTLRDPDNIQLEVVSG
jgi:glyoxylase I family protein